MKPKTTKILHWVFTILFSLFFLMDGTASLLQVQAGKEIMVSLGYPIYLMTILGIAKILGSLAILYNKFPTLKEWAYAGFTIHFISACASRALAGHSLILIISPLLFMTLMFLSYYFWKRVGKKSKS